MEIDLICSIEFKELILLKCFVQSSLNIPQEEHHTNAKTEFIKRR